jgi:hypothetical protein
MPLYASGNVFLRGPNHHHMFSCLALGKTGSKGSVARKVILVLFLGLVAGCTNLNSLIANGKTDEAKKIIASSSAQDLNKGTGAMPIHVAVFHDHPDVVKALLEAGADPNVRNYDGKTALVIATEKRSRKVVRMLLDHGATIDPAYRSTGALYEAVRNGDKETVDLFLSRGANPNVKTRFGDTPLFAAARYSNLAMVKDLVAHGADLHAQADDGRNLLNAAVMNTGDRKREVLHYMFSRGLEPSARANSEVAVYTLALVRDVDGVRRLKKREYATAIKSLELAAALYSTSGKHFLKKSARYRGQVQRANEKYERQKALEFTRMMVFTATGDYNFAPVYSATRQDTTRQTRLSDQYSKLASRCLVHAGKLGKFATCLKGNPGREGSCVLEK